MSLLDLLLPAACAGCGRPRGVLCARCADRMEPPSDPRDRFVAPDSGVALGDDLVLAVAAFRYAGSTRRSLAALKYSGASRIALLLADAAEPAMRRLMAVSGRAAIVPVPLHDARRRERGYNQAELIARRLAMLSGLPAADVLDRRLPTTKQHRLNRAARLRNLRGAFSIRPEVALPRVVIVVDDIITTLATLEACATVLAGAGCEAVYGFAVAREV
ncbi:MAG: ComF family protein [Candidatus Limnocylindria bacterium]